jgi:cAMP-dependent protein kinase regulator
VVSPGEVFNGLFLVIAGRLAITKRLMGAREDELALLERGQFFGVVSALSGTPCNCSIVAREPATLTFLPQRAFNDFVKDYPSLRELPRRLAAENLLVDKDVFVGDTGVPGLS